MSATKLSVIEKLTFSLLFRFQVLWIYIAIHSDLISKIAKICMRLALVINNRFQPNKQQHPDRNMITFDLSLWPLIQLVHRYKTNAFNWCDLLYIFCTVHLRQLKFIWIMTMIHCDVKSLMCIDKKLATLLLLHATKRPKSFEKCNSIV